MMRIFPCERPVSCSISSYERSSIRCILMMRPSLSGSCWMSPSICIASSFESIWWSRLRSSDGSDTFSSFQVGILKQVFGILRILCQAIGYPIEQSVVGNEPLLELPCIHVDYSVLTYFMLLMISPACSIICRMPSAPSMTISFVSSLSEPKITLVFLSPVSF